MHGNRGMEPDLFSMNAKEIRGFLAVLTPQVHPEEMEETGRRIYGRIVARMREEESKARERWQRKRRRRWVAAVVSALLAVSAIAQAFGLPIWETVARWTEGHFVMRFYASPGATMVMGVARGKISAEEVAIWGEEVCDILVEMASVPDLPTWKPEGFVLEMVDQVQTSNGVLLSAAYRNDAGDVLTLTVQELPVEGGYTIEYERDALSGKVKENEGIAYYCMENMGQYMVIWQQNRVALNIAGDINEEEAFHMVDSI